MVEHILAKGGPVFKGTKADYNKFHDDKSTFTGVHQHGGPSTVDKDKISDIKQICDRTGADVRGVKKWERYAIDIIIKKIKLFYFIIHLIIIIIYLFFLLIYKNLK